MEIAGRMEQTPAEHVRRAEAFIEVEQAKPLPDNALIALLCDSIRLTREIGLTMAPEVTRSHIASVGLNVFALDLFCESVAGKTDAKTFDPFVFKHRGIKITLEPYADVDTSHR